MAYVVYIIYSEKIDKYYIGRSENFDQRIEIHNSPENLKWSKTGQPWRHFLLITCESKNQSIEIERYLKKMKSRKYLEYLAGDNRNVQRLVERFKNC